MRPRSVRWLTGFVALVLAVPGSVRAASAQETGFAQVQCEPGIRLFLDGTLHGISNQDQGRLVLEAVPVGERTVKALKTGFTPQERRVQVAMGGAVVAFESLRPRLQVEPAAPLVLETGTLIGKSVPVGYTVLIERANGAGGRAV